MKNNTNWQRNKGILFLVSGPTCSGKSTICQKAKNLNEANFSISCTTRPKRKCEKNGSEYFFLSDKEFTQKVNNNEFIEYATVHHHKYGTLKSTVEESLKNKQDIIFEIDIQGAKNFRNIKDKLIQFSLCSIFVMPADMKEIEKRLKLRHTETNKEQNIRLETAKKEMLEYVHYDYLILSKDRESDFNSFLNIIKSEKLKTKWLKC